MGITGSLGGKKVEQWLLKRGTKIGNTKQLFKHNVKGKINQEKNK